MLHESNISSISSTGKNQYVYIIQFQIFNLLHWDLTILTYVSFNIVAMEENCFARKIAYSISIQKLKVPSATPPGLAGLSKSLPWLWPLLMLQLSELQVWAECQMETKDRWTAVDKIQHAYQPEILPLSQKSRHPTSCYNSNKQASNVFQ